MQLSSELVSKGFSLQDVNIDDLGIYIDTKRVCHKNTLMIITEAGLRIFKLK